MPENPKKEPETDACEEPEPAVEDQQKRGYYYDDSHGYQTFDPNEDDEPEIEDREKAP